jgi:hypothetical protein
MFLSSTYSRHSVLSNIRSLQLSDSVFTRKSFGHVKLQAVIALFSPPSLS